MTYTEEYLSPKTKESLKEFPHSIELSVLDSLYERGFKNGYNLAKSENNR